MNAQNNTQSADKILQSSEGKTNNKVYINFGTRICVKRDCSAHLDIQNIPTEGNQNRECCIDIRHVGFYVSQIHAK